jgi:hypothetical protein
VLKLLVTQLVNIFQALEKETAYYYVKKKWCKRNYPESEKYIPHPTIVYFLAR